MDKKEIGKQWEGIKGLRQGGGADMKVGDEINICVHMWVYVCLYNVYIYEKMWPEKFAGIE